jgi:hypothetical protein
MDSVMFEIKQYMVIWRQLEVRDFGGTSVNIRGIVRCSGSEAQSGDNYTMDVVFFAPDSAYPAPIFDADSKKGYLFMPISDIAAFVDILRNEAPIFGHLRTDKPEWMSITTSQEPVGEGEFGQQVKQLQQRAASQLSQPSQSNPSGQSGQQ